ncbi:signal peptide peptidase SppA [Cryomorpha ignava]|uniref:Signal peptide peptidase SppA n=1 Tax=Cryomorpha ignava TaxID=101383 RepID=A0A7K3WR62_9FLAO|nr:signal peptide peptidase SppA [Cryomorpha ignava]NEN24018.1 signal peptide peptidase SppA [Cryomorpha ignava]
MKQFFKFMLASIAGTIISMFLFFLIFIIVIGGAISAAFSDLDKSSKVTKVEDNTILHIELNEPIVDRGPDDQFNFNFGMFNAASPLGLNQILSNIEKAKTDDRVPGIFLDMSYVAAGMATVGEIRNALIDFKTSGKWIVSYSEVYSQKAYYLASVADEIYVYPEGVVDFRGLNVGATFFKGTLDKLGIEAQIIRGSNNKFKSAVEPFIMDEMSQANRAQTEKWLGSIWTNMKTGISQARNISEADLQAMADEYQIQRASDAVEKGLISGAMYYDELIDVLKEKTETEADKDLKSVTIRKYIKASKPGNNGFDFKKDKIAIIYASGAINSGEGMDEGIGSETFALAIREARRDSSVKAIVLRVNSPGGSALASDVIWRETMLAKQTKPLVVSMGDVAASGGYYISAAADKIFAMPNTITGSIGVFGILPNMKGFFNNKLGITFDGVKTGEFADFGEVSRPLTDAEYAILQNSVDNTYDTFLSRVSEGRDMTTEKIDSIGQGRVWSGTDAMGIGLIDEYGGLEAAIAEAAKLAGLEDYARKEYPKRKDPIEKLFEDLGMNISQSFVNAQLGDDAELIKYFEEIKDLKNMRGIQARVPYLIDVK